VKTSHIPEKKEGVASVNVTSHQVTQIPSQVTASSTPVITPKPVASSASVNPVPQVQGKKADAPSHVVTSSITQSPKSSADVATPHIKKIVVSETKKSETLPSQVQSSIDTLGKNVIYKQIQAGDTIWGMLKENNLV
jgi:hypothetical protein